MTHSLTGTPPKITLFSVCLGNSVGRAASRGASRYYHVDANAGTGPRKGDFVLNGVSIGGIVGTPDLILRKTIKPQWRHMQFDITLVERNHQAMTQLRNHLERKWGQRDLVSFDRVSLRLLPGDNAQVLATYPETVPGAMFGSLLLDPTGCSPRGGAVPMPILARFARALPRFTLLLQFPQGFSRRVWGYNEKNPERPFLTQHLSDYLPLRPYWLISERFGRQGAHIVLAGSDYPMAEWHKGELHLYRTLSARGRDLVQLCDKLPTRNLRRPK